MSYYTTVFFWFSESLLSVSLYSLHCFLSNSFFFYPQDYTHIFSRIFMKLIHSDLLSIFLSFFSSFSLLRLPLSLPLRMYFSLYLSLIPSLSNRKPFPFLLISWIPFQFPVFLVFSFYYLILFMSFSFPDYTIPIFLCILPILFCLKN